MKKILWYWKRFWGNYYRVYKDDNLINEILVYRKKVYILGGNENEKGKNNNKN